MLIETKTRITSVSLVAGAPPVQRWVSAVVDEDAVVAIVRGGESNVVMLPGGQMEVDPTTVWKLCGPVLSTETITVKSGRPTWMPCEALVEAIEAAQWHPDGCLVRIAGQTVVLRMQLPAVRRIVECGLTTG